MDELALFTGFWEQESATTRNVIARIPEGSTYRPDPKSRTASEIAWHEPDVNRIPSALS